MGIHPTAIVETGVELHESVSVGPFSIIEAGAVIGADCVIDSHVRIYGATRLGERNRVCHGATLGAEPQDLGYTPDKSKPLVIGDDNHFKENVNISRGVKSAQGTRIGSHNYFMVFSHVGHDCIVGDHNIFANTAALGGHVEMEHHIFLSGHVAVHQFCRIGAYAMLGGLSGVTQDIPPYVMANGQRAEISGLNLVGLRRNGFDQQQRSAIKQAYKILYKSGLKRAEALAKLRQEQVSAETAAIIAFAEKSERGLTSHR
jgi:UDP-N-acetylglucosamine acyltransferase